MLLCHLITPSHVQARTKEHSLQPYMGVLMLHGKVTVLACPERRDLSYMWQHLQGVDKSLPNSDAWITRNLAIWTLLRIMMERYTPIRVA